MATEGPAPEIEVSADAVVRPNPMLSRMARAVEGGEATEQKDVPKEDVPKKDVPKKDVPKKDVPKKDVPKKDAHKKDAHKKDAPRHEKHTPHPSRKHGGTDPKKTKKKGKKDKHRRVEEDDADFEDDEEFGSDGDSIPSDILREMGIEGDEDGPFDDDDDVSDDYDDDEEEEEEEFDDDYDNYDDDDAVDEDDDDDDDDDATRDDDNRRGPRRKARYEDEEEDTASNSGSSIERSFEAMSRRRPTRRQRQDRVRAPKTGDAKTDKHFAILSAALNKHKDALKGLRKDAELLENLETLFGMDADEARRSGFGDENLDMIEAFDEDDVAVIRKQRERVQKMVELLEKNYAKRLEAFNRTVRGMRSVLEQRTKVINKLEKNDALFSRYPDLAAHFHKKQERLQGLLAQTEQNLKDGLVASLAQVEMLRGDIDSMVRSTAAPSKKRT
jgi:hypothetical protein